MSVLLKSKNGSELELGFIRDAFADMQDGAGDSSWATLSVRAETEDESWEENTPCLNLFEFRTLADWLESVAAARPDESELELLGPDLRFSVVRQDLEGVTISVAFGAQRGSATLDAEDEPHGLIDLHMTREGLAAAAGGLRAALSKLAPNSAKDDLTGTRDDGVLGESDEDLNIVDDIVDEPPGAGAGEDNSGTR